MEDWIGGKCLQSGTNSRNPAHVWKIRQGRNVRKRISERENWRNKNFMLATFSVEHVMLKSYRCNDQMLSQVSYRHRHCGTASQSSGFHFATHSNKWIHQHISWNRKVSQQETLIGKCSTVPHANAHTNKHACTHQIISQHLGYSR